MDLFEAYPQLASSEIGTLQNRSLRLIALAGFVYDEESFYFELGQPRHWGRLAQGGTSIGIGAPKVPPDGTDPPHRALVRHVRREWRLQVDLLSAGHSYLLDEQGNVHVMPAVEAHIPYLFVFTPPRLGGGEVPDALVQAVYLLPVQRGRAPASTAGLLTVARSALWRFLAQDYWLVQDIVAESWASLASQHPVPDDARLQPVLALRGLRKLMEAGALPGGLVV